MKLNAITYTEHETEGAIPRDIQVTLTAREAVFIAKVLGHQPDAMSEIDGLPGGTAEAHEIYACLSGVANSHFENGVDDWVRVVSR